ncbi:MAG: IPT/TIG domain-containing protein, partial [Leptolinea sp.]
VRTLGVTGTSAKQYVYFNNPERLAVDKNNNLFVADGWNERVMVFTSSGQYRASVGGNWNGTAKTDGPQDHLHGAEGVAVDSAGSIYATSNFSQQTIKKFTVGVSGFTQVNINGFGDLHSPGISAMETYKGFLYAATGNWYIGSTVWRSADGKNWTQVNEPGFGGGADAAPSIPDLLVFGGKLYAGTAVWSTDMTTPGQIWRFDGSAWEGVVPDAFGRTGNSVNINSLVEFNGKIYASRSDRTNGADIYRSDSGDKDSWSIVASGGFGNTDTYEIRSMVVFNGRLYALGTNENDGMEVWSSTSGDSGSWTKDVSGGFGNTSNILPGGMALYNKNLYIGTGNWDTGGQLWKYNGSSWSAVNTTGFGNSANEAMETVLSLDGYLYVITRNWSSGMQVWRSSDGINFSQLNANGLGTSANTEAIANLNVAVFNYNLYFGTWNSQMGGQVWMLNPTKIPKPKITAISPALVSPGSSDTLLTVRGTNFISASVIYFGTLALTTTQVNRTTLEATVPASSLKSPIKKVAITVLSPKPGGKSSAKNFVIK